MTAPDSLPADADALRALLLAERARHGEERERWMAIIAELQRHRFGRRSERLDPDQLALTLEDVEQMLAAADAAAEKDNTPLVKPAKRQVNRGALPLHLPREEIVTDIADKTCACCGGLKHRIGEDVAERLDVIPAQFKVIVTRRPKYACAACAGEVVQAPAPERLIENGIPTEALVAQVLVAKYADHTPLYRQAQIYARQGVTLDRSTLADWVGRAAFALRPVHARLLEQLKQSTKLFADETTAPVLDPGRGRVKKGQLCAYARDERPWAGHAPPGVAYVYAPDRKHARPAEHLAGFSGTLQVDGYGAYADLAEAGDVVLAFCWSHVRRQFYDIQARRRHRSPPRHWSASLRSMPSKPTFAACPPTNVARRGSGAASRSLMLCVCGWKPSSPPSPASRPSPRRSATRSRAGTGSPASSTTAASRLTPMSSSARSDRSRSAARTTSSLAPTAAASTGRSLPRSSKLAR
jgi:transposase